MTPAFCLYCTRDGSKNGWGRIPSSCMTLEVGCLKDIKPGLFSLKSSPSSPRRVAFIQMMNISSLLNFRPLRAPSINHVNSRAPSQPAGTLPAPLPQMPHSPRSRFREVGATFVVLYFGSLLLPSTSLWDYPNVTRIQWHNQAAKCTPRRITHLVLPIDRKRI